MADLSTSYMGLPLINPLIASSSPLTGNLDDARRLEDAGAAAIILPSLFEEELLQDQQQMHEFMDHQAIGHGEADSFLPPSSDYKSHLDHYLETIATIKAAIDIPVIGSLNGVSLAGWQEHGADLQQAGCDALELNIYYVPANPEETGSDVESRYLQILENLCAQFTLPIGIKISHSFSSIAHFVRQLERAGAKGTALFNRFYQPDIDLSSLQVTPKIQLSNSIESLERIRWIALLRAHVQMDLAATGGFHDANDVIKAVLAGADAVYLCSSLLQHGIQRLPEILSDISDWMHVHEYESIAQLKGSVCQKHAIEPAAYERANYLKTLKSYQRSDNN